MGAGRQPSRMKQGNIQGMEEQEQRARAIAEADRARAASRERANSMNPSQPGQDNSSDYFGLDKFAAASRERANSMNPSQPGQDNSSDYFGQDKFDTLLSNLERGRERFNRRKVRGMLM